MTGSGGFSLASPSSAISPLKRMSVLGLYISLVCLAAVLFLVVILLGYPPILLPPFSVWQCLCLLVLAAFAEKATIRIGRGAGVSASFLAYFLSAVLLGPIPTWGIAVLAQALDFRRGQWGRNTVFAAAAGLEAGIMALVYWSFVAGFGNTQSTKVVVVAGIVAGVSFQVVNYLLFIPVRWLRRGEGPVALWKEGFQPFLPFHFFFLALSLGLVWIYDRTQSLAAFALFLLPVLGLIYAFRAYAHQVELARTNAALALRNERLALQAVASQVTALDLKDNYTARHSAAVSQWSTDIAAEMHLSDQEVNLTQLASLLHDVGKIGVPDEVLNCPGKLDGVAWALVETHSQNGYKILSSIDQFRELAIVVLHHHEKFDGSGYPKGVAGAEIPLISRIICVADSYSAMVSDRPYRKRLSTEIAKAELRDKKGIQFDPQVVDCFLDILEKHDDRYQQGEAADFLVEFQKVKFLRDLPPEPEDSGVASGAAA